MLNPNRKTRKLFSGACEWNMQREAGRRDRHKVETWAGWFGLQVLAAGRDHGAPRVPYSTLAGADRGHRFRRWGRGLV